MTYFHKTRFLLSSIVLPLCLIYLEGCSGGGDGGGGGVGPVSSAHNPSIASLNDVLTAPSSETTTFQALTARASARFETVYSDPDVDPSKRFVEAGVSDIANSTNQIDVKGGFTGFSFSVGGSPFFATGNFTTGNSSVSDSADGLFRTFSQSGRELRVLIPGPGASELDYGSFGVAWSSELPMGCFFGFCGSGDKYDSTIAFTFGLMTPADNIPLTGTANFSGFMAGTFISKDYGPDSLTGDANLYVNFGSNFISGSLNNIVGLYAPFPDITMSGSFSGNQITGTAVSTSMTGDFVARFFGPNAEEIGGTVAMSNDDLAAMSGAFAAKR